MIVENCENISIESQWFHVLVVIEIYDGKSFIIRDLDSPLGISHLSKKEELDLRRGLKSISEIGMILMEKGDLQLGIEWKEVISKTGAGI